jgi:ribonuclease BN (tRNA processing enzyme)
MKLTILGSGTTDPTTGRNEPGYLLEIGKDLILLDVGSGSKEHIQDSGYNYLKVNHILISHTHVDHVADLPALFWSWWVRKKDKEIVVLGPKGFEKFIQRMGAVFFPKYEDYFQFRIKVKEMHNSVYKRNGWKVKSVYTWKQGHTFSPYALAYRIEYKGKSLVYGADMCYDYPQSLVNISRNSDVLLIESAVPDQMADKGHLTPSRAAQIATEAKVKKLILTHFYPPCEKYDIKKQAQKYFKGPIVLAKDLMQIRI